jgi:hypothetical protein
MPLDWTKLEEVGDGVGEDLLRIVKPYLPALAREGPDVFEGFIKHMSDSNFVEIEKLMYSKLTSEERRELEDQVYKDAHAAAEARFRRIKLTKEIAFRAALAIVLRVAMP